MSINSYITKLRILGSDDEISEFYKMCMNKEMVNAMIEYAVMLRDGLTLPQDKKEAARLYKIAADKGYL